ncbi:glycosyltransferase family 2 protein [Aestuariivivens sediminicola]|uniref:glycosyltransferase family 2 protein n=1 Tax=Aestuariivivens sediminicola TaxID=2913560 RepID=UPI001F59EEFE|nr:glycosyltransferase family 2 protein [Aestuariivivens sediminicola]
MNPKVSVILPNFNHGPYLNQRIDSILRQTFRDFEIIILDDASTDNSLEVLEALSNHPKVSHFIINKENSGSPFKQWKKGLILAKGDYIWIAESDDYCEVNFLQSHLKHIDKADVSVAQTRVVSNVKQSGTLLNHPVFRKAGEVTLNSDQFVQCPITNVSAILFKRIDLDRLRSSQFDSYKLIGDLTFYYDFFNHNRISYNEEAISYYRQLGLSNLRNRGFKYYNQYFNEHIRFIKYVRNQEGGRLNHLVKPYIRRHFYKIRHRNTLRQKLSLWFALLYIKYKINMLIA